METHLWHEAYNDSKMILAEMFDLKLTFFNQCASETTLVRVVETYCRRLAVTKLVVTNVAE